MSSESASRKVVALRPPKPPKRQDHELEFLPAALEIVETPASPAGRAIMITIMVMLVAAIAWACVGKLDVVATAPGKIIPSGRVKVVQPLELGVVKSIAVKDGDRVAQDQVLVEIDPTSNAADQERLARDALLAELDLARLDALLAGKESAFVAPPGAPADLVDLAKRQLGAQLAEQRTKTEGLDRQIAAKTAERDGAVATIAKLNASMPLIAERAAIYAKLRANEYSSRIQGIDSERALLEQQHDVEVERHKVEELTATIAALTDERANTAATFARQTFDDRAKADQKAADSRQEQLKLAQKTALQTLRAPVAGTVEQLAIHTVGGVVTPGETLMEIVPDESKLEIEAMLPNRDIGFVHAGQPVEVKVDAYTFTRYGLLHGVVTGISRDAVAEQPRQQNGQPAKGGPEANDDGTPSGSPYVAHVALEHDSIMTEDGPMKLGPGMSVVAEIKTGRRRVIDYLLSPLSRRSHDALQER
jgi:hemolysin D